MNTFEEKIEGKSFDISSFIIRFLLSQVLSGKISRTFSSDGEYSDVLILR